MKKYVFLGSLMGVGISYVLMHPVFFGICFNEYTVGPYTHCHDNWPFFVAQSFGFSFLLVFFLSLITYRMREEMFRAWWNVARWYVPLMIVIVAWVNAFLPSSGGWGIPDIGIFLIHTFLYVLFVSVSLVRIGIAWYQTKTGQRLSPVKNAVLTVFVPTLIIFALWLSMLL